MSFVTKLIGYLSQLLKKKFSAVMKTVLNKNGENKARLFIKTIDVFLQIQGGHHYAFKSTLISPHVSRR